MATITPVASAVPGVFPFSMQAQQSIVVDPKSPGSIDSPHGLILFDCRDFPAAFNRSVQHRLQSTRLSVSQRPLPGTPISPVCTIGLTAAVAPDLPAYCRWRPSEASAAICRIDRPHRNATENLFAFLKSS